MLSTRPAGTAPAGAKALPEARCAPGREQPQVPPSAPHLRVHNRGEQRAPSSPPANWGKGSAAGRAGTGQPRSAPPAVTEHWDAAVEKHSERCRAAAPPRSASQGLSREALPVRRGPPAARGSPGAKPSAPHPSPHYWKHFLFRRAL